MSAHGPSARMSRLRWIFVVATVLGVFSTVQGSRLTVLSGIESLDWMKLAALNFAFWYIPALLAPLVLRLTERFRFDRPGWRRAIGVHIVAVWAFAATVSVGLLGFRVLQHALEIAAAPEVRDGDSLRALYQRIASIDRHGPNARPPLRRAWPR